MTSGGPQSWSDVEALASQTQEWASSNFNQWEILIRACVMYLADQGIGMSELDALVKYTKSPVQPSALKKMDMMQKCGLLLKAPAFKVMAGIAFLAGETYPKALFVKALSEKAAREVDPSELDQAVADAMEWKGWPPQTGSVGASPSGTQGHVSSTDFVNESVTERITESVDVRVNEPVTTRATEPTTTRVNEPANARVDEPANASTDELANAVIQHTSDNVDETANELTTETAHEVGSVTANEPTSAIANEGGSVTASEGGSVTASESGNATASEGGNATAGVHAGEGDNERGNDTASEGGDETVGETVAEPGARLRIAATRLGAAEGGGGAVGLMRELTKDFRRGEGEEAPFFTADPGYPERFALAYQNSLMAGIEQAIASGGTPPVLKNNAKQRWFLADGYYQLLDDLSERTGLDRSVVCTMMVSTGLHIIALSIPTIGELLGVTREGSLVHLGLPHIVSAKVLTPELRDTVNLHFSYEIGKAALAQSQRNQASWRHSGRADFSRMPQALFDALKQIKDSSLSFDYSVCGNLCLTAATWAFARKVNPFIVPLQ